MKNAELKALANENAHPVTLFEAEVEDGIRNGTIFDAKTLAAWACCQIVR